MKVKIIVLAILLLLITISCVAQKKEDVSETNKNGINWYYNIEEASEAAMEKNVPIFVHFTGSDWCIWCKRLKEEVYDHPQFQDYAKDNLVMVMLDFPRNVDQSEEIKIYNRNMANRYGIRGFPTVLLLSSDAKTEIARTGYQAGGPEKYVEHLKELLKNYY